MSNADPIAFFFTWATYGTWLPGDARGWVEHQRGYKLPDPARHLESLARMREDACWLSPEQREQVHLQIAETCAHKCWTLHAVNCRSNHVHIVASASNTPKRMREQLKAWCTRRLNDYELPRLAAHEEPRKHWWADRGSIRWIYDDLSLEAAILYVRDGQDNPQRYFDGNK